MRSTSCQFRGARPIAAPYRSIGRYGRHLAAAVFALAALAFTQSAAAQTIEGIWLDDSGKGAVELRRCGVSLCGHIVWLSQPRDRAGRPITDELNPSVNRRNRPICGLQVIGRLEPQGDGTWDRGWIYDPKEGKAYDVMLRLKSADQLVVTGYLGLKFLSESFVWRRAPGNLKRCSV